MALLNRLFQKFGAMQRTDITLQQLEELRDGLKSVEAVEIASLTNAQDFLLLLRKFREGVAEADKLHGDNYPQLLNSLLSVGEDGLYSNNLRFIFELIQNVDDCEFANTEDHSLDIHFDFNHNKIVLRYNEEGLLHSTYLPLPASPRLRRMYPPEKMRSVKRALALSLFLALRIPF